MLVDAVYPASAPRYVRDGFAERAARAALEWQMTVNLETRLLKSIDAEVEPKHYRASNVALALAALAYSRLVSLFEKPRQPGLQPG